MRGRDRSRRIFFSTLLAGLGALSGPGITTASAQLPTLDRSDYDQWERLGSFVLDPTGAWLVAAVTRVDGDGELRLHRADGNGDPLVLSYGRSPVFSPDGRWLAYRKGVSADEAEQSEGRVELRLGLVDLGGPSDSVHFEVRDLAFRDDGRWLAALGVPVADSVGANLIVFDPSGGGRTTIGNVRSFVWQPDGRRLAATLRTAGGAGNGVVLFDPDAGTLRTIESGATDYEALTWSDDGERLAVLRAVEDEAREEATHDVLIWTEPDRTGAAREMRALDRAELGRDHRIASSAGIDFSEDGSVVFVGVRPWDATPDDGGGEADDGSGRGDAPDDESGGDAGDHDVEEADVQVWHWNDDEILRAQEWGANRIARQTHLSAWHLGDDSFIVLGDELDEPVRLAAGGRWGLVADTDPYAFPRRFGAGTADWYRVDVRTGARTPMHTALEFGIQTHEELGRGLFYHEDAWHAIDLATLEVTEIGGGRSFTQPIEDYDYPGPRPSWGLGAWEEGGRSALLYDRHDVWRADLRSGAMERLTSGAASDERFRLVNLDPDQSSFGPFMQHDDELVLSVRNLKTKAWGYAAIEGDGDEVWRLQDDARVLGLTRAADADRHAFRSERWDDSPDVFTAGADLSDPVQVTRTNPFQDEFAWGRTELLDYTTDTGHELQAILVYPADFEEGREYPLILYQYERLSDNLHAYSVPSERQYYNYQAWSQAGYFVLMPDIVYEPGRPGPSALDAVEHALDAAVATGHVDPNRMGLIGHSWGGYQASYLPTRTNRFAASVAGAAITNFMSFMGAVHWNGGLPESGHWETGQARMAVPYWDDMEGHLESSPANFITDLETPMLLMHGDADGVVDFRQGLEFYNYARRAGKEVVLLVYPGADHGLSDEAQQVDYHRRILAWFGHYLKGEPAPRWITEGESWVERGRRIGG